jgi:predicted phosphodiesterase
MRVAVISDIHANLPALEAVLNEIERSGEIEEIWCLGDVVGYGAKPNECVALVREHCHLCLLGNHDLAVLGKIDSFSFTPSAAEAVHWTRENLTSENFNFLHSLDPAARREGIGLFHASPRDPVWEYVLSTDQAAECMDVQRERISLIGHSHIALYFHECAPAAGRPTFRNEADGSKAEDGLELQLDDDARWLLNPGSVGQPRDGDSRAAWMELDTEQLSVRYHRVGYEIDLAAHAIVAAALPFHLANRLYVGR